MKDTKNTTSQIRVTQQARAHLELLIPATRLSRGTNVSMTDLASEAILSIPLPQPVKPVEKKRPRRKAVTPMSQTVPVAGA